MGGSRGAVSGGGVSGPICDLWLADILRGSSTFSTFSTFSGGLGAVVDSISFVLSVAARGGSFTRLALCK